MTLGTMGAWLRGGGAGFWSADCRAALIACGIDPDNYGTYNDRAAAEGNIRNQYQRRRIDEATSGQRNHEPSCRLAPAQAAPTLGHCTCIHSTSPGVFREVEAIGNQPPPQGMGRPGGWLTAISESGHMTQNAFYQSQRQNACRNVPPTGGTTGGYGYQWDQAFCMDHQGMAIGRNGVPTYGLHGAVAAAENATAADLRTTYGANAAVPNAAVMDSRENSIGLTTDLGRSATTGGSSELDPNGRGRMQVIDERRQQLARQMRGRAAQAGDTDTVNRVDANSTPNGRGGRQPTPAAVDTAKQCIRDKCAEADDAMRADTINQHSTAGQAIARANEERAARGLPPLPPFTEMSRRDQQRWLRRADTERRQAALQAAGAGPVGPRSASAAQQRACLEFQGNFLARRMANRGGDLPPISGRVPG